MNEMKWTGLEWTLAWGFPHRLVVHLLGVPLPACWCIRPLDTEGFCSPTQSAGFQVAFGLFLLQLPVCLTVSIRCMYEWRVPSRYVMLSGNRKSRCSHWVALAGRDDRHYWMKRKYSLALSWVQVSNLAVPAMFSQVVLINALILTLDQMTVWDVKGVAHCDEPTDNYVPLSSKSLVVSFSSLLWSYSLQLYCLFYSLIHRSSSSLVHSHHCHQHWLRHGR